ncbi:MAG: DNA cytosine methyltransferase [Dissulfurispiraceae bacterium]
MNELHLFAGAGGGILGGILLGHTTVCAVEIEPYCRKVLLQRQRDGILPKFPIWDDVRTFDGKPWRGLVDIVCAGFPCQPFSVAGKRRGESDERNMWPETIRLIREIRPQYAFLENVPGLLAHKYIQRIFGDLAEARYDAKWCVLGADDCGASHRRKRLWILAYPIDNTNGAIREPNRQKDGIQKINRPSILSWNIAGTSNYLADSQSITINRIVGDNIELQKKDGPRRNEFNGSSQELSNPQCKRYERTKYKERQITRQSWWKYDPADRTEIESRLDRVVNGVANWNDRIKAIGNGQVPIVAATAWRILNDQRCGDKPSKPKTPRVRNP